MFPIKEFQTCPRGYKFGQPTDYSSFHLGTDFIVDHTTVYMPFDGTVALHPMAECAECGNMLYVYAKGYIFRFMHLDHYLVPNGDFKEGTPIAITNNTGHSTGPHVHIDISKGQIELNNHSNFLDPELFPWVESNAMDATAFKDVVLTNKHAVYRVQNQDTVYYTFGIPTADFLMQELNLTWAAVDILPSNPNVDFSLPTQIIKYLGELQTDRENQIAQLKAQLLGCNADLNTRQLVVDALQEQLDTAESQLAVLQAQAPTVSTFSGTTNFPVTVDPVVSVKIDPPQSPVTPVDPVKGITKPFIPSNAPMVTVEVNKTLWQKLVDFLSTIVVIK